MQKLEINVWNAVYALSDCLKMYEGPPENFLFLDVYFIYSL